MILKGSRIANIAHARKMARHLLKEENEIVQLWESAADGLENNLVDFQLYTKLTRGNRGIYFVAINPREHEEITQEQWEIAVERIEKELGFTGQPRVQVYHEKDGRPHLHVGWSMVDQEKGRILDPKNDRPRLQTLGLELEKEFGHELTRRTANDNTIEITDKDRAREANTGKSAKERKQLFTRLWNENETPDAFLTALAREGYQVAKGDRAGIVVVDRDGEPFNLVRQLPKVVKAKDVRERLGEEILQALPTLEEAKAMIQEQEAARRLQERTEEEITSQPTREPETPTENSPERREWDEVWKEQKEDLLEAERLTRDTGKKSLPELSEDGEHLSKKERREKRRTSTRSLVGLMSQYMNLSEDERLELRQDLAERIKEDERAFYQAQAPPEIKSETPEETRRRLEELEAVLREQEGEDRDRDRDRGLGR